MIYCHKLLTLSIQTSHYKIKCIRMYNDNILQNVFQRKARWNLRETTAGSDLELLEAAIEKCKKCKLGGTDEDFLRAKRRLKYLKLKKGNTSENPN